MLEEEAIPNPAKFMSEVMRGSNYSFESAIADLVDNSIQAEASEVQIIANLSEQSIAILDNGTGMTDAQHKESMRIASETRSYSPGDLGKYGTGMKAASLSQAERMTVATKSKIANEISVRCLDLNHIKKVNDWNRVTLVLSPKDVSNEYISKLQEMPSGTLVIWQELSGVFRNRTISSAQAREELLVQLEVVEEHLSMVFHRFLDGTVPNRGPLTIKINGRAITPWDPFCRNEKTVKLPEFSIGINESPINLSPYVLPGEKEFSSKEAFQRASGAKKWNESQGFYVYRNFRLIKWGGWLRMRASDEHRKLARIALDFTSDLDNLFQVNVAKSSISLPPAVKQMLEPTVKSCISQAEQRYRNQAKLAGGGLGGLTKKGNGLGNSVSRKMTALAFVSALEKIAAATNLDHELHSIKAAVRENSPSLAREVDW